MKKKKTSTVIIFFITAAFVVNLFLLLTLREDNIQQQALSTLRNAIIFSALLLLTAVVTGIFNYAKERASIRYFINLYDMILENSNVGMSVVNESNQLEYVSNRFLGLLEIEFTEPDGYHISEILPDAFYQVIEQYRISAKGPYPLAKTLPLGDRHILFTVFRTKDTGNKVKYILSAQDYTERINMETKLKEQLTEIQFYSDAKESLLANVSHELKTPLNAIIGLNHILQGTSLDARQKEIVGKINASSDFLLSLINDILDFSKIKNGHMNMTPSRFRLQDLLTDIGKIFYPITAQQGITFQEAYTFDSNLCLHLDRLRLEQVLVNLINNACKFTEVGFVKVNATVVHELSETITLKFSVEDTGIGIDSEDIPSLFTEFHQLENHMTKLHQGTGLGLSICKHLVENMGGTLGVESKKGIGTIFHFTITAPKYYDMPVLKPIGGPPPILQGNGQKVLVVEDTLINYEVVESFLADVDISCDRAPNGPAAIKMCAEVKQDYYKAILMDVFMPQMDGYETTRVLRSSGVTTPIIVMTAGNVDDETKKEYADLITEFLFKPFKGAQLYDKLLPFFRDLNTSKEHLGTEDPFAGKEKAIENLGNNPDFYKKHLNKFKVSYAEADMTMKNYITDGKLDDARILSHSIKGLAAMLGLPYLETASANLEQAINSNNENLTTFLSLFSDKLKCVVQGDC